AESCRVAVQDRLAAELDEIARHGELPALRRLRHELRHIKQAVAALARLPLDGFGRNVLRQQGTGGLAPPLEIGLVREPDQRHQTGSNRPSCCGWASCRSRCFRSPASRLRPGWWSGSTTNGNTF